MLSLFKSNLITSSPEVIRELNTDSPEIKEISLSFDQPPIKTKIFP